MNDYDCLMEDISVNSPSKVQMTRSPTWIAIRCALQEQKADPHENSGRSGPLRCVLPPNYIQLHSHKHIKRANRYRYAVYEQIYGFLQSLRKIYKKMVGELTRLQRDLVLASTECPTTCKDLHQQHSNLTEPRMGLLV